MRKLTLILLLPFCISAQNLYFPPSTGNWDTLSPLELNYCPDRIDSLYSFLESNNSKAFILLKDGKIVLERYFGSFTKDSLWYWASAGKTLTAFITGIAQEQNFLSISDSSSKYLGSGWTSLPPSKEKLITIKDQLSMSTGLDDGVINQDCTYDSCLIYLSDAGSRWAYHNAPYTLLDSVIYHSTGQSINLFMQSRLKNPTGMTGAYIKQAFNNVYFSNARSMARFGLLMLGKGVWGNDTILTDTSYLNQMTNSSQTLNLSYGYLTWLNGKSSFMIPQSQLVIPGKLNPDAPDDMYAAMGKNAQLLNIVPSENLIWMRMGNVPTGGGGLISPIFNNDVWKKINALKCGNVSVDDNNHSSPEIFLFPNPAENILNVKSNKVIREFGVYNTVGQIIVNQQINSTVYSINLSDIEKGMYIIKFHMDDGSISVQNFLKIN